MLLCFEIELSVLLVLQDLQVKSSPPVQPTPINNDPAIIQVNFLEGLNCMMHKLDLVWL